MQDYAYVAILVRIVESVRNVMGSRQYGYEIGKN